jgi:Membrane-fusion protein
LCYEFLVPQGAASSKERDEFKAQYVASREAVIAKEADLSYNNLRSPVRGIVADVQVKVGDVIRSGDPFTQLIKNNQLEARVEVPSTYSDRIELGLPVVLSMPRSNNVLAQSTVTSVDPTIAAGTQALLVKAVFPNPDGVLRNGQRLLTRVQLDARQLPSLPFAAVTLSSGQSFLYRVGSFNQLEAQLGKADLMPDPLGHRPGQDPCSAPVFALQTPVNLGSLHKKPLSPWSRAWRWVTR